MRHPSRSSRRNRGCSGSINRGDSSGSHCRSRDMIVGDMRGKWRGWRCVSCGAGHDVWCWGGRTGPGRCRRPQAGRCWRPVRGFWLAPGARSLVDTAAQRHSRATWTRVWRQGADYAHGEVRRNCEARGSRCARYVPCHTAKLHSASPPQKDVRVVEASSHSCGRSVCEQALITHAAKCGETVKLAVLAAHGTWMGEPRDGAVAQLRAGGWARWRTRSTQSRSGAHSLAR